MANPTWPSTIRKPRRTSWRETPDDNLRRFTPAVGPDITAPRATAVGTKVTFMLDLPLSQRDALNTFHRDTLKWGSLAFDMVDPNDGVTRSWTFQAPPSWQDGPPGIFIVTVSLQRLP